MVLGWNSWLGVRKFLLEVNPDILNMTTIRHYSSALVLRLAVLAICVSLPLSPVVGKSIPSAAPGAGYAHALAAADRFLQAWQSSDVEGGMVLLSNDVKSKLSSDTLEQYFSQTGLAYEITRGKELSAGRYDFPVVLVTNIPGTKCVHRRFSSILVVRTGNNDWAIDKLP